MSLGLLGMIVGLGGLLRLAALNHPFLNSDHAEVAALVSYYYPRDLSAWLPGAERSVWVLAAAPHGIVQTSIAFGWITLVGLLGLPITEWWWNLPFALLGLLPIVLSYRLGSQLGGRRAGLLSALLISVFPIHASLSRSSGLSHIPLAFMMHIAVVTTLISYLREPTARHRRIATATLTLAVLAEPLLPLLFVLLVCVLIYAGQTPRTTLPLRVQYARRQINNKALMALPLLAILWPLGLLVLNQLGLIWAGGMLGRFVGGSNGQAGVYLPSFLTNSSYVVGPWSLALLALLALPMLPAIRRLEARALPLVWSLCYLLPFLLFSRPRIFEYFLLGLAPLAINAALVLARWIKRPAPRIRRGAGAVAIILAGLLLLRAASMIYSVPVPLWAGRGEAPGAVPPDLGLKAAATWIRDNTDRDTLVFGDPRFSVYNLSYYLRRPLVATTYLSNEEGYQPLADELVPEYYLVVPGNELLLRTYARIKLYPIVQIGDETPVLMIYGPEPRPMTTLSLDDANRHYDQQHTSWTDVFVPRTTP